MYRYYLCLVLVVCSSGRVRAASDSVPAVVELFTSQGCSSCPPADALLGQLATRPDVIALSFHVDYWDHLGWRDAFSSSQATQRQNQYVRKLGLQFAFTPQLILDGEASFVGLDARRINAALAARALSSPPSIALHLALEGDFLAVTVPQGTTAAPLDVWVICYTPEADTAVANGENAGRKLHEFNIVRQFDRIGSWSGEPLSLRIPKSHIPQAALRAALILQHAAQGPIVAATTIQVR